MKVFLQFVVGLTVFLGVSFGLYRGYSFFYGKKGGNNYDWKVIQQKKNIIPVAIIGSGPAGLSAALYTSRAHMHTVVFQGPQSGGQLMSTSEVENWPSVGKKQGPEIMQLLKDQAQHFGAVLINESIKRVNFASWPYELITSDDQVVHALCVIIATGAFPERLKNVPGEAEHWGKGVTGCAICDAAFFKDKDVVVVGGGDSAAEQALQLTAYAHHITILVRGPKMRASAAMQDRLKKFDYITIKYDTMITQIEGDGSHVTGVTLQTPHGSEHMAIDGVFLAIGHKPNTDIFKGQIAFSPTGYIAHACRTQETSQEGVFAAGDVSDERYRQAAVASGDGVKAALDAERFLQHIGFDEILAKKIERLLYDPIAIADLPDIEPIESLDQFKQVVLESNVPVVIDFYTKTCSSCAQMMPYIKSTAAHMKNKLLFVKVDIEKVPELKNRYAITTAPYFIVVKDGLVIGRHNEAMTKRELFDFASRFVQE